MIHRVYRLFLGYVMGFQDGAGEKWARRPLQEDRFVLLSGRGEFILSVVLGHFIVYYNKNGIPPGGNHGGCASGGNALKLLLVIAAGESNRHRGSQPLGGPSHGKISGKTSGRICG